MSRNATRGIKMKHTIIASLLMVFIIGCKETEPPPEWTITYHPHLFEANGKVYVIEVRAQKYKGNFYEGFLNTREVTISKIDDMAKEPESSSYCKELKYKTFAECLYVLQKAIEESPPTDPNIQNADISELSNGDLIWNRPDLSVEQIELELNRRNN
jgi:hypothetical protein